MSARESPHHRLVEAIETGEILRVRYNSGTQAGSIRDIRPVSVTTDLLRARDESSSIPKSFKLRYLEIVSLDEPVTYVSRRVKRKTIVLDRVTVGWAFHVPMPLFAPALDITRSLRKRTDLKTGKPVFQYHWTQGDPPDYTFAEGDVFHSDCEVCETAWGTVPFHVCLQVHTVEEEVLIISVFHIEFGQILSRVAYRPIPIDDFVNILKSGSDCQAWRDIGLDCRVITRKNP